MDDLLYAQQWGLLPDDVGQAVEKNLLFGYAYDLEHELLSKRVSDHKVDMARCPFPRPRLLSKGNFTLGADQKSTPVKCPFHYMGSPGLICGSTGSGKTTTARYWSLQGGMLCRGAWLIDSRKNEMRVLQSAFTQEGHSLAVIDAHEIKLNPLEVPEGVDPRSFAPNVADALVRVLNLPPVAKKVLHQSLHHLYQIHGMLSGNTTNNDPWLNERHVTMASILKITVTRRLPDNADLVTRKGKFLRKKRGGRVVLLPVTECGTKYQDESRKWYVQYRPIASCSCRTTQALA